MLLKVPQEAVTSPQLLPDSTVSTQRSKGTMNKPHEDSNKQDAQHTTPSIQAQEDFSAFANELRLRSASAPASRSASFAANLDQLSLVGPSAHRFPATDSAQDRFSRPVPGNDVDLSIRAHLRPTEQETLSTPTSPSLQANGGTSVTNGQAPVDPPVIPNDGTASPNGMMSDTFIRPRPRPALFSPLSGFTPATPPSEQNPPRCLTSAHNQIHTERAATDLNLPSGQKTGRTRSTSASEASLQTMRNSHTSSMSRTRRNAPRQRAHSARTSPTLQPLAVLDHGTRRHNNGPSISSDSVPIHLYRQHTLASSRPSASGLGLERYFSLPPPLSSVNPPRQQEEDELPPPYTPSEVNLFTMTQAVSMAREQSGSRNQNTRGSIPLDTRNVDDEEGDVNGESEDFLSFSTSHVRGAGAAPFDPHTGCNGDAAHVIETETDANHPFTHGSQPSSTPADSQTLSHDPNLDEMSYVERLEHPSALRQFVLSYLIHPLRLLATIPGLVGTFWLSRNAIMIYWATGSCCKLMTRSTPFDTAIIRPTSIEFAVSALWSLTTAYHALSFTTLLLRRWLHYYSLLPSLIRLVALQAICWPLVRLTLHILGPLNPLPAWIIISSTTAFSDIVARWVVSNITDESISEDDMSSTQSPRQLARRTKVSSRSRGRFHRGLRAFWRTIMGAPPQYADGHSHVLLAAERGFVTESDADGESDLEGPLLRRPNTNRYLAASAAEGLRRRRRSPSVADVSPVGAASTLSQGVVSGTEDDASSAPSIHTSHPTHLAHVQRVGRIFHWGVAVRRNLLPICLLAYLTMGVLLIQEIHLR